MVAVHQPTQKTDPVHTACLRGDTLTIFVKNRFTFDHVYDQDSTQQEVYDQTAKPLVLSTLQVCVWVLLLSCKPVLT